MINNKWVRLVICVLPWINPLVMTLLVAFVGMSFPMLLGKDWLKALFILATMGPLLYMYVVFVVDTTKMFIRGSK